MFVGAAVVLVLIAAIRGMWSPCGLSMLSTITPLAERLRGHSYGVTASWFVLGSMAGGASLGVLCALGAVLVHAVGLGTTFALWSSATVGVIALLADGNVRGFNLPAIPRQVNEQWVDRYRPIVYGIGFGWQIGAGFTTYVMTAANYVLVSIAISSGSPLTAFSLCVLFGIARGAGILVGSGVTTTAKLLEVHAWLQRHEQASQVACLVAELAVVIVAAEALLGPIGALLGVLVGVGTALQLRRSRKVEDRDLVQA